jgi:hypothetical protein
VASYTVDAISSAAAVEWAWLLWGRTNRRGILLAARQPLVQRRSAGQRNFNLFHFVGQ